VGSIGGLLHLDRLPDHFPVLESYAYKSNVLHHLAAETLDLFLDSGAYTAKTQGREIDLVEYCDFIDEHKDKVTCYAGLDVIGDHRGTMKNIDFMVKRGLMPIPTFHYGEPYDALLEYRKFPYMALGGIVKLARPAMYAFFDECWNYLVDEEGRPTTKVHGFGLTVDDAMQRYPWYSVDSTTWLNGGRFGSILHPTAKRRLFCSADSPYEKHLGKHLGTITDLERAAFIKEFEKRGFTYEQLRTDFKMRNTWNVIRFIEWGNAINDVRHNHREGLF
jgi:hypothetical protein